MTNEYPAPLKATPNKLARFQPENRESKHAVDAPTTKLQHFFAFRGEGDKF